MVEDKEKHLFFPRAVSYYTSDAADEEDSVDPGGCTV